MCSLPVWVTDNPEPARQFLAQIFAIYAMLPSYRAMLDIEGVHGIDGIALVGSEQEVADGLAAVAESGATDFAAVVMGGNPDELGRDASNCLQGVHVSAVGTSATSRVAGTRRAGAR